MHLDTLDAVELKFYTFFSTHHHIFKTSRHGFDVVPHYTLSLKTLANQKASAWALQAIHWTNTPTYSPFHQVTGPSEISAAFFSLTHLFPVVTEQEPEIKVKGFIVTLRVWRFILPHRLVAWAQPLPRGLWTGPQNQELYGAMGVKEEEGGYTASAQLQVQSNHQRITTDRDVKIPYTGVNDGRVPGYHKSCMKLIFVGKFDDQETTDSEIKGLRNVSIVDDWSALYCPFQKVLLTSSACLVMIRVALVIIASRKITHVVWRCEATNKSKSRFPARRI